MIPVLTGRFAVVASAPALVLLLVGRSWASIAVVNAVVVAAGVWDWWRCPAPQRVGVERLAPAVVPLGSPAAFSWRLTNPLDRPLRVQIADELAPSLSAGRRRAQVDLPRRGRRAVSTTIEPRRRGRFDLDELVVRTHGPLGLVGRQAARSLPTTVRVYPAFRSRREAELRLDRARLLEIGLRSAQGRGGGTEFDQLREYADGDEFRHIDWAATARSSKTIVRTFRAERNQNILLMVDSGRTMAGLVQGVPRLDHAMDVAMAVVTVAARMGDRIGLMAFNHRVLSVVPPRSGPLQLNAVTDALYDLQPELTESDFRGALLAATSRFRRRHLLLIITDLVEPVLGPTLIPALSTFARDHLVLVAAARDPEVHGWARQPVEDEESVYRRAAAIAAVEERQLVTARLTRLGAVVVDEEPGRLAGAVIDRYLDLKAAGRL